MPSLRDILAYITDRHEQTSGEPLTNARLTKIVYLADWGASLKLGRPITNIEWTFNHHGPWVPDVILEVERHPDTFETFEGRRHDGKTFRTIKAKRGAKATHIDDATRDVLDRAVAMSADKPFGEFIDTVYATHPVRTGTKYTTLDLRRCAQELRRHSIEESVADRAAASAIDNVVALGREYRPTA